MQWKLRKADAMEAKEYLPEAVETLLYWSNARERGSGELPVARGPYCKFRGRKTRRSDFIGIVLDECRVHKH